MKILKIGNKLCVRCEAKKELEKKFEQIGGKLGLPYWEFPIENESLVEKALNDAYGDISGSENMTKEYLLKERSFLEDRLEQINNRIKYLEAKESELNYLEPKNPDESLSRYLDPEESLVKKHLDKEEKMKDYLEK